MQQISLELYVCHLGSESYFCMSKYRCIAPNQTPELTAEIQVLQEVCVPPFAGQTNAEHQREILKDISLPICLHQSPYGLTFKSLA